MEIDIQSDRKLRHCLYFVLADPSAGPFLKDGTERPKLMGEHIVSL